MVKLIDNIYSMCIFMLLCFSVSGIRTECKPSVSNWSVHEEKYFLSRNHKGFKMWWNKGKLKIK
jgi:hypothetical protein